MSMSFWGCWRDGAAAGLALTLAMPGHGRAQQLAWEARDGYRVAKLAVPASGRAGFTLLTPEQTGVFFTNQLSYERSLTNQNLLNGAGVCAGDFDGDGLPDVHFCNLEGRNGLFRNRGQWRFEDVTLAAGTAFTHLTSRGAAFADVNGDGRLDLLVTSLSGPNACLLNIGQGRFQDVTEQAGLVLRQAGCESLTLADVNGDGTLDLYITNNGENSVLRSGGAISVRMIGGKPQVVGRAAQRLRIVEGQIIEFGPPDAFYLNDGAGRFQPVSWTDGTFRNEHGQPLREPPRDLGLTAAFRDLNGDGFPDLYVCNDFQTPDRIWLNDGKGRFRALPDLAMRTTCHFAMSVDFADIDRDGFDDIYSNDMLSRVHRLRMTQIGATNPPASRVGETWDRQQARRNTLQLNRGDGTYADIANFAGVHASDWTWCVVFVDVDLDGYEDLLNVNGHAYDTQDLDMHEQEPTAPGMSDTMRGGKALKDYPPLNTPNFAFRNRADRTFEEVGAAWGFCSTQVCHGLALADFDLDGDLDVAVSSLWKPPLLYRNESAAPRVAVRLRGQAPNTHGIGAKITLRGGAVPAQSQEIQCGGHYLSSDEPMRVFAAGALTNRLIIEVAWRSGRRSVVTGALPNHIYELDEPAATAAPPPARPPEPTPWFQDVSERLGHVHSEPPFNDPERQPLLHRHLDTLGPGVAWFDLDGDGRDELVLGAGRGGTLTVFRTDEQGGFRRLEQPAWNTPAPDDLAGLAGWVPAAGQRALLAGVTRYEIEPARAPAVLRLDAGATPSAPQPAFAPQADLACTGPLCVADVDGDGDLDVFVGGRVVPGRYPEPASSKLFRNSGGRLELDPENSRALANIGLVSGATFSDLNGDGWPDLILACEWGPVRVFTNAAGRFGEATAGLGLEPFTGWWNGVTTGDLDGDGRLDIVAANWGLNSSYHAPTPRQPVRFFYGDLDENGTVDLIETEMDEANGALAPRRDMIFLSGGWPLLRTRFKTHKQFSLADINTVLGDAAPRAKQVQASALASILFLNRGGRFEAQPLPAEAQFAPAFAVSVADADGDGHEDVFLSQNFFAMRLEEPRLDAGRGLWLRGDGAGGLAPVPGQVSGMKVYGEQRGAALADFDADGRVDLVVAQPNAATQLYRNQGAKPGLRVRLSGPPGNPDAVGAAMRLVFGQRQGPAREIHAGSGYWSQDSATQVLATPERPTALWVRWPGGKTTTSPLPAGAAAVVVDPNGEVKGR
jgi:hypothetical protein